MTRLVRLGGSLTLLFLVACAPALPSFAGGRTVPSGRTDLALGGAVRVPVGDMVAPPMGDASDRALALTAVGGATPAAFVRHGLTDDVDLGVEATASSARLLARGRFRSGLMSFVGGIAPHVGLAHVDGELVRAGATIPLVLAIDVVSAYEIWIGVRAGLEHVFGELGGEAISMTGLRTGGMVGLAVGFRRFSVLVELGVDHELWTGSVGAVRVERSGLVLTPAFGFRLRL